MATPAFHRLLVTPLTPWGPRGIPLGTPWGPLGDPLGTPWGPLGTPWGPLGDPLGTPWGPLGTPWGPLGDPSGTPWGPRGTAGDPLGSPWCPKRVPRAPQERLRALKSAPRESNKRRKRARKRSEGAPRGLPRRREELLEDPKGCQGVPRSTKIDFQRASHGQPLTAYDFQSHETEFCRISVLRQISEPCKTSIFEWF